MRYVSRVVLSVGVMMLAGVVRGQEKGSLFFLTSVPEMAVLRAPLAPEADARAFEAAYGKLVADAKKGKYTDRAAAAAVLRRKSEEGNLTPGMKRLLLINAFDLAARGGLQMKQMAAYADEAYAALEGQSVALAARRVDLMEVMVGLASDSPREAYPNIGQAYFELAELCLHVGMIREAEVAVDNGQAWIVDENEYRAKVGTQVEGLRAAIAERRAAEGKK